MLGELENVKKRHECRFADAWGNQPNVVFDSPPGKQTRFLEYHGQSASLGRDNFAVIVHIDAGDDPQHRRLAAAGGAYQHAEFPARQREGNVAQHLKRLAGRCGVSLADDANIKQFGAASATRVVQWVAPPEFQSPG